MVDPAQATQEVSSSDVEQPALPWAHRPHADRDSIARNSEGERCGGVEDAVEDGDEDMEVGGLEQALSAARVLEAVGLQLRDKVEVKWEVAREDGSCFDRWWGARVLGPDSSAAENGKGKIWVIIYDAYEDFEEQEASVIFLTERRLFDLSEGVEMRWRKEGELLGDTEFDEEGQEMVTLTDIIEQGEMAGFSEEKCAELERKEMQKLPIIDQQLIASRFQEFKDSFVGFLKRKERELGENPVIGANDVADFVAEMSRKRKQQ